MFQVAYNRALNNCIVGISEVGFPELADDVMIEQFEGEVPDLSMYVWSGSTLKFEMRQAVRDALSVTDFMRRFTQAERLAIRQREATGDLVLMDAMDLMRGTRNGIVLTDPDVIATLGYIELLGLITAERKAEILNG